MKTNKTIYIDLEILRQMMKHCEKNNIGFSKLIEQMWIAFSKTYKR